MNNQTNLPSENLNMTYAEAGMLMDNAAASISAMALDQAGHTQRWRYDWTPEPRKFSSKTDEVEVWLVHFKKVRYPE